MKTRSEHLEWCKQRAIEYLKDGNITEAFSSFQSDMTKHPETENHLALQLGTMLLIGGQLSTIEQMENWIIGFN